MKNDSSLYLEIFKSVTWGVSTRMSLEGNDLVCKTELTLKSWKSLRDEFTKKWKNPFSWFESASKIEHTHVVPK